MHCLEDLKGLFDSKNSFTGCFIAFKKFFELHKLESKSFFRKSYNPVALSKRASMR